MFFYNENFLKTSDRLQCAQFWKSEKSAKHANLLSSLLKLTVPQHKRSKHWADTFYQIYPNFKDLNRGLTSLLKLTSTSQIWTIGVKSSHIYPNFKDLNRGLTSLLILTSTSKILTRAIKMHFQTYLNIKDLNNGCHVFSNLPRVGHSILSRSERSILSHSFKECSVLSHSFFEFLVTFETQKNGTSHSFQKNGKERKDFPILLQKTWKNAKIFSFFYKEREIMRECFVLLQKNARKFRSFAKERRTFCSLITL